MKTKKLLSLILSVLMIIGTVQVMTFTSYALDGTGSDAYTVTISAAIRNGTVTADVSEASEGDTVTLTITPDEGYSLKSVSATDAEGNDVPVTDNTFKMPASEVTVSAEFEDANTIYIVGDFNLWDATDPSCVMTKNSDGKYVITKELESGIRRFKIVKNGSWDSSLGIGEETVLSNGVAAALVGNGFDAQIELASATAVTFLFDPVAMTVTASWDEAGEESDDATYSIVGSFNGWDVRDTSYTMALNSDGKYVIAAEIEGGNYEFKIANNYSWEGNLGISDTEDAISNGETVALVENGVNSLYFELAGTSEVTFVFDPVAMTLTVSWEEYVPTLFEVIIADTQNGSVSASPDFTVPGDTVILTVTPDEGYTLKSVSVTDEDGGDVPTTDNTFTMPASNVIVTATFKAEITVYISTYADFPADEYKATDGENALDYLNANYFMAQMYDMVGWELLRDGETYYVTEDTLLSDGDTCYMIWWLGNGGSDLGIFGNCTVDMFEGISYNSYAIGMGGISGVKHKVDGVEYTFDLDTEVYTIKSAFESKGIDTDKTYTADGNEVDLDTNMPLAYTEFEAEKAGHSHPVCGATHTDIGDHKGECEAIEWTAWNGDETILDSGYYYLTGDVNAYVIVVDGRDVHICLNGYTLDGSGESTVFVENGSFTLTDCVGTGKLTGGTGTDPWGSATQGGGIYSEPGGIVTVYGGSITGNSADYMGAGICSYGNLYLYGGSVAGNSFNDEEAQTIDKSQVYASNLILYGGSFDSVRGDYITLGGSPEISGFLRTNGSSLKISGELTNTTPIPLLCGESLYGDDTVQIGSGYGGYVDRFEAYEQYAEIKNENGELVYLCPIRVVFRSNDGSGIIYEETLPATGGKLTSIPELPAKKGYAPFWHSYTDGAPTPSTETVYTKSAEYIGAYEPYTIELEELPNGYRVSSPNGTVKEDGIAWHKATKTTVAVNLDNAEPYAYDGDSSSYENGKWVPLYGYYFITNLKARDVLIVTPDDMSNFVQPYLMNNTNWGIAECIVHDTFVEFKIKEDGQYTLYSYDSDYVSSTTPVSAELNTYEIGEAIEGETSNIFNNGTNGEYYNVRVEFTDGTVLEEVFEYDIPIPASFTLVINLEREYGRNPITDTEIGYTSEGKLTVRNSENNIFFEAFEEPMSKEQSLTGKTMLVSYIDGVPAGDCTIIFEKPGYCTLEQSITFVEGDNELIVTPVCGDIRGSYEDTVGDGIVDIDDFIRVLRGFDSEAPALLSASVDLNEDGVVNVADLSIIKTAMTKASEQQGDSDGGIDYRDGFAIK